MIKLMTAQFIHYTVLLSLLAPLTGALIAGLGRHWVGRRGAHSVTLAGIAIALVCSLVLVKYSIIDGNPTHNSTLYTWLNSGGFTFTLGFFIDPMAALMMTVVSCISLLVHIYSIGYMHDDDSYPRFFSYMSLFTFAMLTLVSANNLLQLFFGWEGVGLVSYLLIGFWFKRDSAIEGSLKAFLVNRVGDFGFLLGMILLFAYIGSVDYTTVFAKITDLRGQLLPLTAHYAVSVPTLIGLLLFVGAMGKSAQVPLHVWLPESMEGPTPISALIHAATMVTAGIYLVARFSPLYALSPTALSVILIVGATGALFMGLVGVVLHDIKRIIAYSTLSQLGYMMAGAGAGAAAAGMFHLFTHAFFKALLFLGAGSVIIALHHEQDIRKMGNLRRYMPITYLTFLIGSLSLTALPPFAGFYSKDAIITAVEHSTIYGARYAYICLLIGVFVTALYSFRVFFLTFHSEERLEHPETIKETHKSILLPLLLLAVPSVVIGALFVKSILYTSPGLLGQAVNIAPASHTVLATIAREYRGWFQAIGQAVFELPFWLALAGIACAWLFCVRLPQLSTVCKKRFSVLHTLLTHKYGIDLFYDWFFVRGTRALSHILYKFIDTWVIDNGLVNGSWRGVRHLSQRLRRIQSGYLYHYAFAMIVGLTGLLIVVVGWV